MMHTVFSAPEVWFQYWGFVRMLEQLAGGVVNIGTALSIGGRLSWLPTNTTHWVHEKTQKKLNLITNG